MKDSELGDLAKLDVILSEEDDDEITPIKDDATAMEIDAAEPQAKSRKRSFIDSASSFGEWN